MIVLTRHTNVLLLLVVPALRREPTSEACGRRSPPRWHAGASWRSPPRWPRSWSLPQLAIYYEATGHWIVSSYGDLGFTFTSPHLWGVLFSVQKGLFFWSPLLLAAVAGFWLAPETRPFALAAGLIVAVDTYLIASWWDWQFGGSYGHRGFVDVLPFFAIGLAAFFAWSARHPTRAVVVSVATCALVVSVALPDAAVLERRDADVRHDLGTVQVGVPEVAVTRRGWLAAAVTIVALGSLLAYLRDPAWLAGVESGFRGWRAGPDGLRYRWTTGHASFFVPSSSSRITIPARVTFDQPGDPPVLVRIAVDDRPADEFELRDDRWNARRLVLPPPGRRRLRRIDIRVDRLRSEQSRYPGRRDRARRTMKRILSHRERESS